MDLNKINTLCTIVDCGSMSKASSLLFCSQPAISKKIVALEQELGYQLFTRYGKKMVLNENGKLVYKFGKECQAKIQTLKTDLQLLNSNTENTILFGTNNYIGMYILSDTITKFKNNNPDKQLNYSINFTPNILAMLDKDEIQFALLPDGDYMNKSEYNVSVFYQDKMKLIFPPAHPLSLLKTIAIKDILKYNFLISRTESLTREYVVKYFKSLNINIKNTVNLHNSESIKQGVIKGIGISILAENLVKNELEQKLIVSADIQNTPMYRTLYLVRKKSIKLSNSAKTFIEYLKNTKK